MWKVLIKLVFRAIPLVLFAIVSWWVINTFFAKAKEPLQPPSVTIAAKPGVIEAIKSDNKQIFVEYYITKDIDYSEAPQGWAATLGIKQQYVLLLKGRVPAGFDLSAMSDADIWVSDDGTEAQITLPPPVIFEDQVSLDLENSRILAQSDTCPDFLCQDSSQVLLSKTLPEGKALITADAREAGILNRAALDGQSYYENLLQGLGFEKIKVIVSGYTN